MTKSNYNVKSNPNDKIPDFLFLNFPLSCRFGFDILRSFGPWVLESSFLPFNL